MGFTIRLDNEDNFIAAKGEFGIDGDYPYAGNWWVPGLCLGYEHSFTHALAEFFKSLDEPSAEKRYPDFRHALGTQYVCDAVLESAKTKQWVDVKQS